MHFYRDTLTVYSRDDATGFGRMSGKRLGNLYGTRSILLKQITEWHWSL